MDKKQRILDALKRGVSYVLVAAVASAITWALASRIPSSKLEQLADLIDRQFIGQADGTQIQDAAAEAMITALGDRWSYYIPASEYAQRLERQNNEYVGVGITVVLRADGQGFDILAVEETGPAFEAGIRAGDIVTHVDGKHISEVEDGDIRSLIVGKENTTVAITVLREGQRLDFTVTRRTIRSKVADGQLLENGIGLITIYNFYEHAGEETIEQVKQLTEQGAGKLIFDVRDNPGGYVSEMVEILDYLLPEGELFCSVSYDGREDVDMSDAACLEMPMAVLINGDSYSAAELFAAALWEYDWATTVGEPTCGKAHYQHTIQLMDGSAVALSVGKYTTPKGVNLTEAGGLQPDIEVAPAESIVEPGEDPQLQAAIRALTE